MFRLLIIILFFSHVISNSIQIHKFRNNWLILYIQSYNKEKQKINIKNLCFKLYYKIYDKTNNYLMQVNNEHILLSDEDKVIIETILSLMY
jgi:hypothetical protein